MKRTRPRSMSARKIARFRSENAGAYPRSTIQRKEKSCSTHISASSALRYGIAVSKKNAGCQENISARIAGMKSKKIKPKKKIAPHKKRSTTPIRSKPFEGRLDKRSHWTASGNLKLYGADKEAMRAQIFERAGGRCEGVEVVKQWCQDPYRAPVLLESEEFCGAPATEWSHKPCVHIKVGSGHGQGFKCDSELCGAAECERCHRKSHGQY